MWGQYSCIVVVGVGYGSSCGVVRGCEGSAW